MNNIKNIKNAPKKNLFFYISIIFVFIVVLFFIFTSENKTIKNNKNIESMFSGRSGDVSSKNKNNVGYLSKEALLKLFDIFPTKKD